MKAYLYCTMAKPYLYDCGEPVTIVKAPRYNIFSFKSLDNSELNSTVCFECEINKVENIKHDNTPLGDDMYLTKSISIPCDFEKCTCLSIEQLVSYSPNYALHLENAKQVDYQEINNLYNDFGDLTANNRCRQMPQNMRYVWEYKNGKWTHCVLISIQSKHLCNIANGLKDIEVRKSILNELKELIK